jgi:SAM-dependent methyltransferase
MEGESVTIYRDDWHARHREKTRRAAQLILASFQRDFAVESVLDIGCGHADWLRVCMDLGVTDVLGCDGPWIDAAQLVVPRANFRCEQLDRSLDFGRKFDLVLCTEVGEHLPKNHSDLLVDTITAHSDLVFYGAAIPHQGGYRHINEQWQSYWVRQFDARGFRAFDLIRPLVWNEPIDFWYKQNNLVYVKRSRQDLVDRAEAAAIRNSSVAACVDLVHPQKYMDTATYNSVAFRPFIRGFPGAAYRKLKSVAFGG